ncbi:MAG: ABC transporter ATP-binding protein [Deltaproteobacteria bacterium]|nr:ABC transporter ATP-binding protein [Deltaproteobacteria bacterium]
MPHILSVENLEAGYGAITVLHGVSLDIHPGEIVALVGANGAGKSTLLMALCGVTAPRKGRISFEGREITGQPPHLIMRQGLAQVPEGRRIFPRMSVEENLRIGANHGDADFTAEDLERMYGLFPILRERRRQNGGTLSGGEQQMLAIGRALMSRPRLLLLDEPSLGLAPLVTRQILSILRNINEEQGTAILLVEQNAYAALNLASRGYVLSQGQVVLEGPSQTLLADPSVKDAYLGE